MIIECSNLLDAQIILEIRKQDFSLNAEEILILVTVTRDLYFNSELVTNPILMVAVLATYSDDIFKEDYVDCLESVIMTYCEIEDLITCILS